MVLWRYGTLSTVALWRYGVMGLPDPLRYSVMAPDHRWSITPHGDELVRPAFCVATSIDTIGATSWTWGGRAVRNTT